MATGRRSSKRRASASGGGLGNVRKAEEQNKRRAEARNKRWLKLDDGDVAVIRGFPAEYFKDGYVHRVVMDHPSEKGKKIYPDVMCLDQDEKGTPCPGCKDELQRRYKFWYPVIVRDMEGDDGKEKDAVAIWSGGITIAKLLNKKADKHKLHLRDLEVERSGSTKDNTEYSVEWDDEEDVPLTSAEKKLMEAVPDLSRYTKIKEYNDFYKLDRDNDDDDDSGAASVKRGNPFSKKKKADDAEDDDAPKARRRSSTRRGSAAKTGRTRRRI